MPLGDSITRGNHAGTYSYRPALLAASPFPIKCVGSGGDHEGHPRWDTGQILQGCPAFLRAANPEIVLLQIGTNDLRKHVPRSKTLSNFKALLATLAASRVRLCLVAGIPPYRQGTPLMPDTNERATLNSELQGIVSVLHNSRIRWVGTCELPDAAILPDGLHPTRPGDDVLGRWWAENLRRFPE